MALYLFRHSRTRANESGLVLGSGDPPATPEGLAAFAALARHVAAMASCRGIARVFSSPLVRARACARILAETLDVGMETLPGLAELDAGRYEGLPRNGVLPGGGPLRRDWRDRPEGGESLADAEVRVGAALKHIHGLTGGTDAALVGHAVVNRVVLFLLGSAEKGELLEFAQPHGLALRIDPDGRLSWLGADGSGGSGLPLAEGEA